MRRETRSGVANRKTADRPTWQNVLARRFIVRRIDSLDFHGYVSLLHIDAISTPIYVTFAGEQVCIADQGYDWLQHFPDGTHHVLLAAFDGQGELVQWYIDIIGASGIDERGIPWYDDLYLDIVIAPSGDILLLDGDELDEALRLGQVTPEMYDLAWREASRLMSILEADLFPLLFLSEAHYDLLRGAIEQQTPGSWASAIQQG
jgi:predicted RNA-binding protein associated with RNAse of E/G family